MAGDRVDVVIGAGSGMGRAAARAIRGDRPLLVADRDGDAAQATAAELGGDVEWVECDITDATSVARLAGRVGTLGALVSTAGLSPTMAPGARIYDVNLVGTALVVAAFEPKIAEGSAAVCFASIAGHGADPDPAVLAVLDAPLDPDLAGRLRGVGLDPDEPGSAYGMSKLGVIRLVRHRAGAWAARGARILSLSPGIIDTPMGRLELEHQPAMQPMIDAVGRMGSPDEIASVVAFLVSAGASFMNGCDVLVDGGFLAIAGL